MRYGLRVSTYRYYLKRELLCKKRQFLRENLWENLSPCNRYSQMQYRKFVLSIISFSSAFYFFFFFFFVSFHFRETFSLRQHFRSCHTNFFSPVPLFLHAQRYRNFNEANAIVEQVSETSFYKRLHIDLEVFKAIENRKWRYIILSRSLLQYSIVSDRTWRKISSINWLRNILALNLHRCLPSY